MLLILVAARQLLFFIGFNCLRLGKTHLLKLSSACFDQLLDVFDKALTVFEKPPILKKDCRCFDKTFFTVLMGKQCHFELTG